MSEEKVIIEEPAIEETPQEVDVTGLSAEEIKAGEESGVIPKKNDDQDTENEKEKLKAEDKKEDDDNPLDPDDFDQMEEAYQKDEKKFHKSFTANAKALYFKHKRNKQLMQEAQEALDEANKEKQFYTAKEKSYLKQLADIEGLIDRIDSGDENITTADIRKVIAFKKAEEDRKEDEKTGEEKTGPDEKQQRYLAEKAKNTELLGMSKYEDFTIYVALANEVVKGDKDLAELITRAYMNPDVDEDQLVEKIVKVARTHPDFGKKKEGNGKAKEETKEKIERIVANAGKKKTSAAITGGSGRREVDYNDLTIEDIPKLSQKQWNDLPAATRERLMRESSK